MAASDRWLPGTKSARHYAVSIQKKHCVGWTGFYFLLCKYPHNILYFFPWSTKSKLFTLHIFTEKNSNLEDLLNYTQLCISHIKSAKKKLKIILAWVSSLPTWRADGASLPSFWMGGCSLTFSLSWNAWIASWTRVSMQSIWIGNSKVKKWWFYK